MAEGKENATNAFDDIHGNIAKSFAEKISYIINEKHDKKIKEIGETPSGDEKTKLLEKFISESIDPLATEFIDSALTKYNNKEKYFDAKLNSGNIFDITDVIKDDKAKINDFVPFAPYLTHTGENGDEYFVYYLKDKDDEGKYTNEFKDSGGDEGDEKWKDNVKEHIDAMTIGKYGLFEGIAVALGIEDPGAGADDEQEAMNNFKAQLIQSMKDNEIYTIRELFTDIVKDGDGYYVGRSDPGKKFYESDKETSKILYQILYQIVNMHVAREEEDAFDVFKKTEELGGGGKGYFPKSSKSPKSQFGGETEIEEIQSKVNDLKLRIEKLQRESTQLAQAEQKPAPTMQESVPSTPHLEQESFIKPEPTMQESKPIIPESMKPMQEMQESAPIMSESTELDPIMPESVQTMQEMPESAPTDQESDSIMLESMKPMQEMQTMHESALTEQESMKPMQEMQTMQESAQPEQESDPIVSESTESAQPVQESELTKPTAQTAGAKAKAKLKAKSKTKSKTKSKKYFFFKKVKDENDKSVYYINHYNDFVDVYNEMRSKKELTREVAFGFLNYLQYLEDLEYILQKRDKIINHLQMKYEHASDFNNKYKKQAKINSLKRIYNKMQNLNINKIKKEINSLKKLLS